jgi:pilin isopeptide linkage protein
LTLEPVTVTLEATKKLIGDDHNKNKWMTEGEFNFEVVEDDEVITTGINEADTDQDNISKIIFDENTPITYTADDLGTHVLTVYEVAGNDPTITYSDVLFFAIVKVDTVQGSNKLNADVTYSTQNEMNLENGKPVFTNTYTYLATGSLALTGTKELISKSSGQAVDLEDKEFNFVVKDADGKEVAKGSNDVNGTIKFDDIEYKLSDIGTHTYTIEEINDNEMFVEYSTDKIKVTVEVADAGAGGTGKLEVTVKNVQVNEGPVTAVTATNTAESLIKFTNYNTFVLTGINLDILPYILIVVLAAGFGVLMLMRRRKRI